MSQQSINNIRFSCCIKNTDVNAPLGFEIWLNDQQIYNTDHVDQTVYFEHDMPDADGQHVLKFVMKGKTSAHTKVDESGHIVKDAMLILENVAFDDINLSHDMLKSAVYSHDYNGSGTLGQHSFYNNLGCNGTVTLEFCTPFYLWLLENM